MHESTKYWNLEDSMGYRKAKRKARIVHAKDDYWNYKSLHQLSKGKIHCSCARCSAKTNTSINKSRGSVDQKSFRYCRLATTNYRYGKKTYSISDCRRIDSMNADLAEYMSE